MSAASCRKTSAGRRWSKRSRTPCPRPWRRPASPTPRTCTTYRPRRRSSPSSRSRCRHPRPARVCDVQHSMDVSNGTTALGVAVALGEIKMPAPSDLPQPRPLLLSGLVLVGVELTQAQVVVLGNPRRRWHLPHGHAVMRDASTSTASSPPSATPASHAATTGGGPAPASRQLFPQMRGRPARHPARSPADHARRLRRPPSPALKAAVGAVAAVAIGDPAVFVSVDAMHQGPHGGGPVIAIVDAGE